MRQLTKKFVSFMKQEDGPTAVEYAVMLALIIVVCIAAITTLGSNANNTFSSVATKAAPAGAASGVAVVWDPGGRPRARPLRVVTEPAVGRTPSLPRPQPIARTHG